MTQDKRRTALIERLGTIADMACAKPLKGELGDIAYDLLREAAAQIASDNKRLKAIEATGVVELVKCAEAMLLWIETSDEKAISLCADARKAIQVTKGTTSNDN